jgi:hypothetical protein
VLTLHDIATIQISKPETVKRGASGEYIVQSTTIADTKGDIVEIKCFMAEASGAGTIIDQKIQQKNEGKLAIRHTQERMQQLKELIKELPPEDRQGRFLRISELAEMISQGLDTIGSSFEG